MPKTSSMLAISATTLIVLVLSACSGQSRAPDASAANQELQRYKAQEQTEQANLVNFADLDLRVYSGQKWDEVSKSHADNIIVHWPDGRQTVGIDPHIADMKGLFAFAPDTRIRTQSNKIAQGNLTSVTGVMEGTFTRPLRLPDGRTIAPTHKPFKYSMVTVARWENGKMAEEWLMWDNAEFLRQIGVNPADLAPRKDAAQR
ncbi:ester cyclase [Pseudomonas gessardii]|uniref:ester cyclase n=1 Tax=Pseudomonas gessardii TaxID=78544 RepID=UPI0014762534|nr:ester cyclase [Pseudomonas gessardii]NNA88681.1 ester cyclase [Pseudomonas gessardii]